MDPLKCWLHAPKKAFRGRRRLIPSGIVFSPFINHTKKMPIVYRLAIFFQDAHGISYLLTGTTSKIMDIEGQGKTICGFGTSLVLSASTENGRRAV
jgi:hypothetical protein